MLPHNLILLEAIERQYRDRIQKEAKKARRLHKLVVKEAGEKVNQEKKPVIELGWLDQVRT